MKVGFFLIGLVLACCLATPVTANEEQGARMVVMVNGDDIESNDILRQYMDGVDLSALRSLADASGGQAVDFNELISHLPDPLSGWTGLDPTGMMMNTGEGTYSFATREYQKDGADDEVNALIWDTQYLEMGPWFVYWSGAYSWESTEGYMRSTTYKGYPAWESRDYGDQSGVLVVGVVMQQQVPEMGSVLLVSGTLGLLLALGRRRF